MFELCRSILKKKVDMLVTIHMILIQSFFDPSASYPADISEAIIELATPIMAKKKERYSAILV